MIVASSGISIHQGNPLQKFFVILSEISRKFLTACHEVLSAIIPEGNPYLDPPIPYPTDPRASNPCRLPADPQYLTGWM
jgi:hypothetical protein